MDYNIKNNNTAFTLIEVILILVLVGGVFMAMYSIYSKTVVNDRESANESIASNLAQEGVEIIRNVRDENEMADGNINSGLTMSPCYPVSSTSSSECGANYTRDIQKLSTGKYENCPATGCTDQETVFTRECYLKPLDPSGGGDDGTKSFAASCVVEWTSLSGIDRKARAMTILTDWQP